VNRLLLIIFLLLALAASITLALRVTIFTGKAYTRTDANIALENSYLFASPIQAKADGQEIVRVTVFILDNRGLGTANHTIRLSAPSSLTVKEVQPLTDDTGKAVFDLTSTSPGRHQISATIDNRTELPQKVNVIFY